MRKPHVTSEVIALHCPLPNVKYPQLMNLAWLSLKLLEPKRIAFERSTMDPVKAQQKVLLEYIRRNANTEYGLKYGFAGIRSIRDYQASVPVVEYEAIRHYVDRMAKGEENILTRDKPIFFGSTSGTTNLPKLIPTTDYSESRKTELLWLWSYYIARDHPDVVNGKVLAIISPEDEGRTPSGIRYGAESGHGYRSLPWLVKKLYVLPPEVFDIKDYDARYYTILRLAMERDVTDVATLNPNTIVLLCQKIAKWQERIIKDIRDGTLSRDFDIPDGVRRPIESSLRKNARRADELSSIAAKKGRLLPADFWPNMRLVECWMGGMMKLYLKEIEAYFGKIPIRDMGCLSTEARSSIPTTDNSPSGVLAISTNFYEFMPKEDAGKKDPRLLLCSEVEAGREYFIIVTTAGGLYRYNIDDIVKVDGFFNKTPMIEFVQKGSGATSLAGEKLYESHVNDAVSGAIEKHSILLEFFCAVAESQAAGGPRYAFLVEFSGKAPDYGLKKAFLETVEDGLRSLDSEYLFVRNAQLLKPPVLKIIRQGDFEKYRARKVAQGAHDGQFKAPELTQDTDFEKNFFIEEILAL